MPHTPRSKVSKLTGYRDINTSQKQDLQIILYYIMETNIRLRDQNMEIQNQNTVIKNQNLIIREIKEIREMVSVSHNIPAQIFLLSPIILFDARGQSAPFHLKFINSAKVCSGSGQTYSNI